MSISVKVVDTRSVEGRGPSDDTVNFVTLGKKKLSQVRTILTGDTSDQCSLCLKNNCSRRKNYQNDLLTLTLFILHMASKKCIAGTLFGSESSNCDDGHR